MTFASNVAPRKILRPKPEPWHCDCRQEQPGYLTRCTVCKTNRPKEA